MAFRAMNYWKSIANGVRGNARFATSSSARLKAYAPTADFADQERHTHTRKAVKGDYVPVYVAIGMILLQLSIGLFTVKHELLYSPQVRVKKKARESVLEVDDPDRVVKEADKFLKRSFFRKIAHIQEFDSGLQSLPNPKHRDAFAYKPHAETLKSVGIDPPKLH